MPTLLTLFCLHRLLLPTHFCFFFYIFYSFLCVPFYHSTHPITYINFIILSFSCLFNPLSVLNEQLHRKLHNRVLVCLCVCLKCSTRAA